MVAPGGPGRDSAGMRTVGVGIWIRVVGQPGGN